MQKVYDKNDTQILGCDVFAGIEYLKALNIKVNCIVTSPPYWGLRNNAETSRWWGEDASCAHGNVSSSTRRLSGAAGNQHPSSGFQSGKATTSESFVVEQRLNPSSESKTCLDCGAWYGSLGSEPVLACVSGKCNSCYVCHVVAVSGALSDILADDGVFFLNLGDSQSGTHSGVHKDGRDRARNAQPANANISSDIGLKPKDVIGMPTRVADALQKSGWHRRSDIIWVKGTALNRRGLHEVLDEYLEELRETAPPELVDEIVEALEDNVYIGNGLPESVKDRPTRGYEYIFMLTKRPRYAVHMDAVAEESLNSSRKRYLYQHNPMQSPDASVSSNEMRATAEHFNTGTDTSKKNIRNVWIFPTKGFGWQLCKSCGEVFEPAEVRKMEMQVEKIGWKESAESHDAPEDGAVNHRGGGNTGVQVIKNRVCPVCGSADHWQSHYSAFPELLPETAILMGSKEGDLVLDPFAGSGTTMLVARRLGRKSIGFEINGDYQKLAETRLRRSK